MTAPASTVLEWAERAAVTARSTTSETAAMNSDDRAGVLSRFWAKVNKTDSCWLWTANLDPGGYGQFWIDRALRPAHRVSFELAGGKIPDGFQIDHLCRVRNCVNPAHLEPVTQKENIQRGDGGSNNRVKTHCPKGHPYAGSNLCVRTDGARAGGRRCRECDRARKRVLPLTPESVRDGTAVALIAAALSARKEG